MSTSSASVENPGRATAAAVGDGPQTSASASVPTPVSGSKPAGGHVDRSAASSSAAASAASASASSSSRAGDGSQDDVVAGGGAPSGQATQVPIYCYRIEDTALRDRFECMFDLSLPVSANAAIIADKLYSRPRSSSGVDVELPAGVGSDGSSGSGGNGGAVAAGASGVASASVAAAAPDASEMDNSPGGGGRRSGDSAPTGDGGVVRRSAAAGGEVVVGHRFPDAVLYRLAPTGMSEECDESMKRSIKSHSTFIISPDGDASLYAIPDLGGEWGRWRRWRLWGRVHSREGQFFVRGGSWVGELAPAGTAPAAAAADCPRLCCPQLLLHVAFVCRWCESGGGGVVLLSPSALCCRAWVEKPGSRPGHAWAGRLRVCGLFPCSLPPLPFVCVVAALCCCVVVVV